MTNISHFNNPEFGNIRTVTIDGEPWFVGKDIAEALGYSNASKAVVNHVAEEDKKTEISAYSQNGNTVGKLTFINESGLYSLILSSKLPNAKKFKHWITSEVLPSIRKHGVYGKQNTETDKFIKCAEIMASCLSSNRPYVLNIIRHIVPDVDNESLFSFDNEPVTDEDVEVLPVVGGKSYKKPFNHNQFNNYLIEHGIKNYWVEAELKCSQGLVRKWRYGLSNPTEYYRMKLCEVLNLPVGYFDNSKRVRRIQPYE